MDKNFSQSDKSTPDVSVVIVNFNGMNFLEKCLDSLSTAFERYTFETIVIDNASTDGSQYYLRERKDIQYIESLENLGFTKGNNRAIDSSAHGKIILLLNNDTRIESCLDPLIDFALKEDAGAVGCRLIYGDGRPQFSVGLDHTPLRLVLSWIGLEKYFWLPSIFRRVQTNSVFYKISHFGVDWISGACLATRRDIWESIKGFDENFFMYCEDVDYCLRVRKLGKKNAYLSSVTVTHYEGAGKDWVGRMALLRTVHSYKNYYLKYYSSIVSKITFFSLSCVFHIRALAFLVKSLFSHGKNKLIAKEKSFAFYEGANKLLEML
ncbi:MAG: glycosyltransferase family 2 protein [Azoarcus sp.]|jgi:GT2 family glycosyltransferase|nr:glycosyltransferase family 2 protein [Azoarcus sp.]